MADLRVRLAEATGFEWDAGIATKYWAKHEVSQAECEQVYFNAPLVLAADPAHSAFEDRVISARPMGRGEREVYRDAQALDWQGKESEERIAKHLTKAARHAGHGDDLECGMGTPRHRVVRRGVA